jgi:putative transposase
LRRLGDAIQQGEVWLADCLYSNYWVVAMIINARADVVMRQHAGRTPLWFRGRGHAKGNRQTCWNKPARPTWMTQAEYDTIPDCLHLRALRMDLARRGFRTRHLVLVTTLTDAQAYSAADLAELYRRRWQAELDLRSIKVTLQMDILRGQTPEMVRKEVWGHLLGYNIIRAVLAESARVADVRPDELSFTGAWQTVNAFMPHLRSATEEEQWQRLWLALIDAVAQHRVGDRPGRIEPRAVKRRPKRFPTLKGTRKEARRRLKKRLSETGAGN